MQDQYYHLVYDAGKSLFDVGMLVPTVMFLVGIVNLFVVPYLIGQLGKRKYSRLVGFLFAGLGGTALVASLIVRSQCLYWADAGKYTIIEGAVKEFHPMPYDGHEDERMTVNGIEFRYSDFDFMWGGFNNTRSHGGPIHEGLRVRIGYRGRRILKLWIAEDGR